jgi:uncharacterized glyoxalase superfamily protein PhnB
MNTLIPCLRYEDAPAAIDFLCRAYDARDTEGNIWTFSNYDPFTGAVKTPPA